MDRNDIDIGQVVKSIRGRDKGRFFIVRDIIDANHVFIVDGDIRKLDKPKKKKLKHLVRLNIRSREFKERVEEGKKINNAFIRRELEKLGVNA